jgi:predicted nucleic acid-binding protein
VGLTVLDAGVIIALLDRDDPHHLAARALIREARERGDPLVLPASAYAECLVGPSRRGPDAVRVVDALLDELPIRVEPASRTIAAEAAAIRATHGRALRLPDALVLATAHVLGADLVMTTDRGWPGTGLSVTVLTPGAL